MKVDEKPLKETDKKKSVNITVLNGQTTITILKENSAFHIDAVSSMKLTL